MKEWPKFDPSDQSWTRSSADPKFYTKYLENPYGGETGFRYSFRSRPAMKHRNDRLGGLSRDLAEKGKPAKDREPITAGGLLSHRPDATHELIVQSVGIMQRGVRTFDDNQASFPSPPFESFTLNYFNGEVSDAEFIRTITITDINTTNFYFDRTSQGEVAIELNYSGIVPDEQSNDHPHPRLRVGRSEKGNIAHLRGQLGQPISAFGGVAQFLVEEITEPQNWLRVSRSTRVQEEDQVTEANAGEHTVYEFPVYAPDYSALLREIWEAEDPQYWDAIIDKVPLRFS